MSAIYTIVHQDAPPWPAGESSLLCSFPGNGPERGGGYVQIDVGFLGLPSFGLPSPLPRQQEVRRTQSLRSEDLACSEPVARPLEVRLQACPGSELDQRRAGTARSRLRRRAAIVASPRLRYVATCELVADRRPIVLR